MVEITSNLSSTECLKPHSWNLRVIGFYRLSLAASDLARQSHELYMWLILFLVVLYTSQEVLYTAQVWEDLDKVVAVSFILLTHFDCISKLLIFRYRADRIQTLINKLDGADYLHHAAHRTFMQDTAKGMRVLLRAYTGAAMFTCLLWAVFPYVDHLQGIDIEFPIWTPGTYNTDETHPVFECMLAYTSLQKALQGFANTTMDAFVCAIFALCRTHVTILRFNLESLVEASAQIARIRGETMEIVFRREFKRCMDHYNLVIEASRELQDIFGGVILFQFAVSGWIICMTAYKITDLRPASVEFISMLLYMSCILTELFIFCYYGNELTIEYKCEVLPAQSDRLVGAAYSMRWLHTTPRQQRSTLLFMERAKRPIRPTTGSIIPLSMPTFMKILKSSYTFYALLRETKK